MLINAEKTGARARRLVWLIGPNPEVLSMVERSSLGKILGRDRMHFNLELAVAKYMAAPPLRRDGELAQVTSERD
jgi:sulfate permease, SulP family